MLLSYKYPLLDVKFYKHMRNKFKVKFPQSKLPNKLIMLHLIDRFHEIRSILDLKNSDLVNLFNF